jgi:hypothetical protein
VISLASIGGFSDLEVEGRGGAVGGSSHCRCRAD